MSKVKQKQPSQRPTWLLIGILIVGALLVVAGIIAAMSGSRREPFVPQVTGAPRAEVDQTSIDHGAVRFDQFVESVFRLRNVGDQPLRIMGEPRVELVQGC